MLKTRILTKETENIDKWKDILYSRFGRILLKSPHHPKQSTDSMQSLSKFQQHLSQKSLNWYGTIKILNDQSKLEK